MKSLLFAASLLLISCQSANVSPLAPKSVGLQSRGTSPDIVQGGSGSQWVIAEPGYVCAFSLVAGPAATIWYTDGCPESVVRIDMAHNVTSYPLPSSTYVGKMTAGPDGNLWVTTNTYFPDHHYIVRVTPAGHMTTFQVSCAIGPVGDIAGGPDGNVWFGIYGDMIGRITPTGSSTCYATTGNTFGPGPAAGPDGNVWFTESRSSGNLLAKITPSGTLTEYADPNGCGAGLIAAGDGYLYCGSGNGIVRISPSDGVETIISPERPCCNLATSGTGNKSELYYAGRHHLRILHLATGRSDNDDLPYGQTGANWVAYGADGNLWYDANGSNAAVGIDVFRILTVNPTSMNLAVGQSQTATASEREHPPSTLSAQSLNSAIATVANGPSPGEFKITGQAAGSTSIRVGDHVHNYVDISVTVQ